MVQHSRFSYAETIRTLSTAIADAGNTIFATIDQAAAAKRAGLSLRPTTLVIFGNPKGGTLLMDAFPLTALDLPLKLLIWEDGATVNVAYTPASEIASRYTVPKDDPRIAAMDHALTALTDSVSA